MSKKEPQQNYQKVAMRVSSVSIVANVVLSALKLLAGIFASSAAMISDAVHSLSDVFSTIIVMIGVKISSKEADKNHPYGHERLECVASILLAVTLALVGAGIGYSAINTITGTSTEELAVPGMLALIAAIVSIVVKEAMYHYTMHYAKQIHSTALKADAWHHRSDALSSIGSLIGIGGAMMGWPILDPIASIVICLFIMKAAWDIFMDAINKMIDHSCSEEVEKSISDCAKKIKNVKKVDSIKTREFGSRIYVDLEIAVDGKMSLNEAHEIAEAVHDKIEKDFPEVKHCMVHENPA